MCISATFCCSYLRYYFLYLSYQGLFRGRRAKRLMATGLCHGGWGAATINYPHQRSKPRPCLLLCGLRCGRGFAFALGACLAVPWQRLQNFTIVMQPFSVTRYRFKRQDIPLNRLKQFVYALFTQKSEGISYPTQALHSEAINPNYFL